MRKIAAIGGGEIGRPGYPVETTSIDKEIIRLSGKRKPKVLFIPTASSDSAGYVDVFKKHFGKRLGCGVETLYLTKKLPRHEIQRKIIGSDIIYVGGGNTLKMLKIWRSLGIDKILKVAWKKGIVLSGLSAGSICWFSHGISDSRRFYDPKADYIKINALGFVPGLHCPHYNAEKDRKPQLKKMMKKGGIAIAIDNCCAIAVIGDRYRIIRSKKNANAYKVYWKNSRFFEEKIEAGTLKDLLKIK